MRLVNSHSLTLGSFISIHAPVWGATWLPASKCMNPVYFNPRTRMGCDTTFGSDIQLFSNFNPRTRMGCDDVCSKPTQLNFISIHAPVWGATISLTTGLITQFISIHAPVWGATVRYCTVYAINDYYDKKLF